MIALRNFIIMNSDGSFQGYIRIYKEEYNNDVLIASKIIGVKKLTPDDLDNIDEVVRELVHDLVYGGYSHHVIWWFRNILS